MVKTKNMVILFFYTFTFSNALEKVTYKFSHEPIDVVIPCHKKDHRKLRLVISGITKNVYNVNRIIVISDRRFTDEAEWFDEKKFPFSKQDIVNEIVSSNPQGLSSGNFISGNKISRVGWIFQQLLKLYAPFVIPKISENVLVVDADTIFLHPVKFQRRSGAALFNPGDEYNVPYFIHMNKLIPGLQRVFPKYSGISHHMLLQRCIVEDLFEVISEIHGIEPWRAIVKFVDPNQVSSVSEYEIYFNFAFSRTNQLKIRHLKWLNANGNNLEKVKEYKAEGYDYVSCHTYP